MYNINIIYLNFNLYKMWIETLNEQNEDPIAKSLERLKINILKKAKNEKIVTIEKWANLISIVKNNLWLAEIITSDTKLCNILADNIAQQNNIEDVTKIRIGSKITINMDKIHEIIEKYWIKKIIIKKKENISSVVKKYLWLSRKEKSNEKLCNILADNILKRNKITDSNKISVGDTLYVNMNKVDEIIKSHKQNQWKQEKKEQVESKESEQYITIHSVKEFENSNEYLVKKIRNDTSINWKFYNTLRNGYSIKFLKPIETKNSPSLTIEEITKPNEKIDNKLAGKTFVLDPGHWSMDIWSVWLAQFWPAENKEKVVVYESAVMMDLTYRVARQLRAHWANVIFTHYMNKRWIMNGKDLPPCSRVMDSNGNEKYQDIWGSDNKDLVWTAFWAGHLTERSNYANNNTTLFISLHADLLLDNNGKVNDTTKILSIKYDERQTKSSISKTIAEGIINNGFWYYFNGTLAGDVKRDVGKQNLWVLKPTACPAILIEFWNISQENQAYVLRQSDKREDLAKSLVSSLIATL